MNADTEIRVKAIEGKVVFSDPRFPRSSAAKFL